MGDALLQATNFSKFILIVRAFFTYYFMVRKNIIKITQKWSVKNKVLQLKLREMLYFCLTFLPPKYLKDTTALNGKFELSAFLIWKKPALQYHSSSLCRASFYNMHIFKWEWNQIDDLILLPISWGNSSHAIAIDIDNPVVTFSENAAPIDMPSITLCKLSPNNTNRANVDMGLLSSCKDKISLWVNVLFARVYI